MSDSARKPENYFKELQNAARVTLNATPSEILCSKRKN